MPVCTLAVLAGDNPFFGPAVNCPEINDEKLDKISKTFFQLHKITFKIF